MINVIGSTTKRVLMYLKYFFFIDFALRWIQIRTNHIVIFETGKISLDALTLQIFQ